MLRMTLHEKDSCNDNERTQNFIYCELFVNNEIGGNGGYDRGEV